MVASYAREHIAGARSGQLRPLRQDVTELLAHDLRSPLAAVAMNVDYALAELGASAPADVRDALEDCRRATLQSVALVADMVDAMQLASGELRPHLDDVDVQSTIATAVRGIAPGAASRSVRLMWSAEPTLVRADLGLLGRVLAHVLERALRHAGWGGSLDITVRTSVIVVRVRASDPVPLVAEGDVRALGMLFSDAAMRAQGGAVWTEPDADGALVFCVALPS